MNPNIANNPVFVALTILAAAAFVGVLLFALYDEYRLQKNNSKIWRSRFSDLYLKTNNQIENMNPQQQAELEALVAATKGKFFSISFIKKDGTQRVINGKDKYFRLLNGGENMLRGAGYVPFVNRNTETWASAHKNSVVRFRCGKIQKDFNVG